MSMIERLSALPAKTNLNCAKPGILWFRISEIMAGWRVGRWSVRAAELS